MNNTIRKRNQQTARRKVKKLLTTINDNQCTSSSSDEDLPAVNHADPGAKHTCTDSDIDHGQDPSASDLDVNASHDHAHAEDFDWDIVDRLEHLIEDDDSEEEDHSYMLRDRLANWAAECSIPLSSVTKLLHVLRDEDLDVPAEARTLLKTPRSGTTQVSEKSGGDYIYFGVEKTIKQRLDQKPSDSCDVLELSFNIDGLPIFKSRSISVWPIQCSVDNIAPLANYPFVVAIYSGTHKPSDNEFLEDLVEELKTICRDGINGKRVVIRNFICDAPARSQVKGTIQFNGRYGCDFCDVRGDFDGRMMFLYEGAPRTDETFRHQTNPEHHRSTSAFLELDIDMVQQFPIDAMHCVDLGVVKRLLVVWKEGPLQQRLSAGQIQMISDYHQNIRKFIPSEFNRKPRSLDELKMWKATEFRMFLMYTGPVILKDILPRDRYLHFMSLSVAVCILHNTTLVRRYCEYAHELLSFFVNEARSLYTDKFVVYNVHCLLHLSKIAQNNQCLQNCTAYKFENNMSKLKRCIRGTGSPIIQIANRLAETSWEPVPLQPKRTKVKPGTYHKLNNGNFCCVHEVQAQGARVVCEVFSRVSPLYEDPCDSRIIGVCKGNLRQTQMEVFPTTALASTVIGIPMSLLNRDDPTSTIFISLMHIN